MANNKVKKYYVKVGKNTGRGFESIRKAGAAYRIVKESVLQPSSPFYGRRTWLEEHEGTDVKLLDEFIPSKVSWKLISQSTEKEGYIYVSPALTRRKKMEIAKREAGIGKKDGEGFFMDNEYHLETRAKQTLIITL